METQGTELVDDERDALRAIGIVVQRSIAKGTTSNVYIIKSCGRYGKFRTLKRSKKYVAKVMDPFGIQPAYFEKFCLRELRMVLSLGTHPHIIDPHAILKVGQKFVLIMRYAERGNLLDYLLERGPLREDRCRKWLRQLVVAVMYLHQLNICHRNIKAENVLITENKNIKLADFGFSRFTVSKGQDVLSCTFCGTLAYAAPEVLIGKKYNPKLVDVWAIGVTFYLMINGSFPFNLNNLSDALNDMKEKNYENMSRTITKNARDLIDHLMQYKPTERIPLEHVVFTHFFGFQWKYMLLNHAEKKAYTLARWVDSEYRKKAYQLISTSHLPMRICPPLPPDDFDIPSGFPEYDTGSGTSALSQMNEGEGELEGWEYASEELEDP